MAAPSAEAAMRPLPGVIDDAGREPDGPATTTTSGVALESGGAVASAVAPAGGLVVGATGAEVGVPPGPTVAGAEW